MGDYKLQARIPHELADEVKDIVEEINEFFPETEATFSTIARHALKEYIRKYRSNGDTLFIEVPMEDMDLEDIERVKQALLTIPGGFNKTVEIALDQLEQRVFRIKSDEQTKEIKSLIEKRRLAQRHKQENKSETE